MMSVKWCVLLVKWILLLWKWFGFVFLMLCEKLLPSVVLSFLYLDTLQEVQLML